MGTISAIGMAGIVIWALIFGMLIGLGDRGWRIAFILLGLTSMLSGLLIALLVKEPVRGDAEPELEGVITREDADQFRFSLSEVKKILKSKTVWINCVKNND